MIDCPNVEMRDRLPDLANETLEPSVRALVLAHVESCVPCTAEIEIIRSTRLLMVLSTPRVNVAGIVSALPQYGSVAGARPGVVPITEARSIRRSSWGSWRAAAAITVLMAGVGSYAIMKPGSPVSSFDSTSVSELPSESRTGLALTGALADLSEAELNALVKDIDAIEALPSTEVELASVAAVPTVLPDSIAREMEKY